MKVLTQEKNLDSPQESSSSKFIEKWANAEYINSRLGTILMALIAFCAFLTFALVKIVLRPKPIYYIPGAQEAGVAWPNQITKESMLGFGVSWILNWANFSPATVDDVYARSVKSMAPGLYSKTKVKLDKEIQEVKRNSIASLFSLTKDPVVMEENGQPMVICEGDKNVYIGKENITNQKTIYKVYLKQVSPTETNPYGLMIEDLKQEVVQEQ